MTKEPLGETGQAIDRSRTNIFIMDEELWNWAKFQSKSRHQSSVSEFIFQLIKNEKETHRLELELLIELEKYFELNHYTLGDVASKTGLTIEYINDFLVKLKIPLDNDQKAIFRIHYILIENHVAPKEMCNLNRLNTVLKFERSFPSKRDLLLMFHEDSIERRNEIFATAFDFLGLITEALNRIKHQFNISEFPKIPSYSKENMPVILFELGISPEEETDIFESPFFFTLKELNAEHYFLLAFDLAGWTVVLRTISQIMVFQAKNLEGIIQLLFRQIQELWAFILQSFNDKVQNQPEPMRDELLALLKTK